MDWLNKAESRKEELISELQQLIQINSVLNKNSASEEAPFGEGPLKALNWMLTKGEEQGFTTKNIDNYAGHIEMGQGEELLGILCHVDVVPVGDDWTFPPFKGEVWDGKLYGRGAIDDKGPTVAAWLAMKMVKDAGIPLNKRVRMIIGTDEETGFRCVERYFEKEEMPTIGFAPDADFPLINAEKGIAVLDFSQKISTEKNEQLVSFQSGHRNNMVPDRAQAVVTNITDDIEQSFQKFIENDRYGGTFVKDGEQYIITINGKSAHALEPEIGVNAGVRLAKFLLPHISTKMGKEFLSFIVDVFAGDVYGSTLKLNYADDASGQTTLNAGVITFNDQTGGNIQVSMRYSVTYPFEEKLTLAQKELSNQAFALDIISNSPPHYVPEEDKLVQTLLSVYRRYTGDNRKPLSTGGGTYARTMKKGVAFGMLFEGEPDVAHQKDEYVVIENLVKAAAIYAETIVELASEK